MILKTLLRVRFLLRSSRGDKHFSKSRSVGVSLGLIQALQVFERETFLVTKSKVKTISYFDTFRSNCSLSKRILQRFREIHQKPRRHIKPMMDIFHTSTLLFNILKRGALIMPLMLKQHSVNIVRMCTQQCECVMAHRVRRGQQIFSLYSKMWDEMALNAFIRRWQKQLIRRGKMFLLSAVGVTTGNWNWDVERISDKELLGHLDEIDFIHVLLGETMICQNCNLRLVVNAPFPNIIYCQCKSVETPCTNDWMPFIEDEDVLVWRKEESQHSGLHSYKVYGSYNDVTAEDFLAVQLDINFRKEWDPTAVQLHVIDSDPETNSDVVYWELEWPRLFANRDYVFNRRYIIDPEKKIILVVNQGTCHPSCPEKPGNQRVVDYWSFMVIRPYTEFNEPGLEFGLTYFDNPGINIPSTVTAWVAQSGLPRYLVRLRQAVRDVGSTRLSEETGNKPEPGPSTDVPPPTDNLPATQEPLGKQQNSGSDSQFFYTYFNLRKLFI